MIGAVIALDSEAEALLSQMEIENIQTVHGKPVYLGSAFGKKTLLCFRHPVVRLGLSGGHVRGLRGADGLCGAVYSA